MSHTWKDPEKMYEMVAPLVDKMRAKYPPELNIDGFEPALTSDIAEIVSTVISSTVIPEIKGEIEKGIKGMKAVEYDASTSNPTGAAHNEGYNQALDTVLALLNKDK